VRAYSMQCWFNIQHTFKAENWGWSTLARLNQCVMSSIIRFETGIDVEARVEVIGSWLLLWAIEVTVMANHVGLVWTVHENWIGVIWFKWQIRKWVGRIISQLHSWRSILSRWDSARPRMVWVCDWVEPVLSSLRMRLGSGSICEHKRRGSFL